MLVLVPRSRGADCCRGWEGSTSRVVQGASETPLQAENRRRKRSSRSPRISMSAVSDQGGASCGTQPEDFDKAQSPHKVRVAVS
jgi:hypothetical protein